MYAVKYSQLTKNLLKPLPDKGRWLRRLPAEQFRCVFSDDTASVTRKPGSKLNRLDFRDIGLGRVESGQDDGANRCVIIARRSGTPLLQRGHTRSSPTISGFRSGLAANHRGLLASTTKMGSANAIRSSLHQTLARLPFNGERRAANPRLIHMWHWLGHRVPLTKPGWRQPRPGGSSQSMSLACTSIRT